MAWPLIAAAVAQLGSSAIGAAESSSARAEAARMAREAYDELLKAGYPPDLSQEIIFDQFQQAGLLTPELEQAIKQDISKVSEIQESPELRDAQMAALEGLKQRATVGLTPEEKAEYNKIRANVQRDAEAQQQAILRGFQERGQAGSGQQLAAQLSAAQAGAQRGSEEGDRISADASRRALQAIQQGGQLAGQVRGQEFDINRARAQAADEMSRFNVENQRGVQSRNIAAKNAAQEANLRAQQSIANANVDMGNAERIRQANARRQYYMDLSGRATGLANAKLGQASQIRQEGQQTAQNWQNIGAGAGGFFGDIGKAQREGQQLQRDDDRFQQYMDLERQKLAAKTPSTSSFYDQPGPWASGYKFPRY